jgi:hypothetical protein
MDHNRFLATSSPSTMPLKGLVAGFPLRRPGFEHRSGHVGFVVDKIALGQIFSEYMVFSANPHSTDCSTFMFWG